MDWTAKAAWIYENGVPDFNKLAEHGIKVVYVDPRSANTAEVIKSITDNGLVAGIYTVPSWQPQMNGLGFAKWTSYLLNTFLPRANGETPPYMADVEGDQLRNAEWVDSFLSTYRNYQPARPSSMTVEPFQGGYVPVKALVAARFHLYPQVYYGDMSPADSAAVVLENVRSGMPADSVHPFYDGAAIPRDARDGAIFTAERLP